MFLFKSPTGIWHLYYINTAGKRTKVSTKTKVKSKALHFLRTFRLDEQSRPRNISFVEFELQFMNYAAGNFTESNGELYRRAFRNFLALCGNIPLRQVSALHWDKYKVLRQRVKENGIAVSPITINIELRCLKAAMNTALRWGFLATNPFASLKQCVVPEMVPTFFTRSEIHALLQSIEEQWLKEIVMFGAMTGMRQGEILHLRWEDLDLVRRTISIQSGSRYTTKAGKRRIVPMNDITYLLLSKKSETRNGYLVFTIKGVPIKRELLSVRFKRSVKKAGITNAGLHFHSLRHTFASWLVQNGLSLYEVQKLLGHSSAAVTQMYSHLLPDQMHSTVNKIGIE